MSAIYFHSQSADKVRVSGRERANAGQIVDGIALGVLRPDDCWWQDRDRLLASMDPPLPWEWAPARGVALYLRTSDERLSFRLDDGSRARAWDVRLNTAMRLGSRPVRLMTRLHGQCEVHAWVAGQNRAWLAEIVDEGLRDGVMRTGMGWDKVATLLRTRDDEPVVTSYSVCDQFPNNGEPWETAMPALAASGGGLEIKPDDFDTFYFGAGVSAMDLLSRLPGVTKEVRS